MKTEMMMLCVALLPSVGCLSEDGTDPDSVDESVATEELSRPCGSLPYTVQGAIETKYYSLGGTGSFLHCPITYETPTPGGRGRFNHFQGGSIYWSPQTGPWSVHGLIRDRWAAKGWEQGPLGFPTSDELGTPNGQGRFNRFENGIIYFSNPTGAHAVRGRVLSEYGAHGFENGLGFPTAEEKFGFDGGVNPTWCQNFQHGSISCNVLVCGSFGFERPCPGNWGDS